MYMNMHVWLACTIELNLDLYIKSTIPLRRPTDYMNQLESNRQQ